MSPDGLQTKISDRTNRALNEWCQGDCVVGHFPSYYVIDPRYSLDPDHVDPAATALQIMEEITRGFVVVSQTCDIVRDCSQRPFVEVCPLIEVSASSLREIRRQRRPSLLYIPGLQNAALVGDLDRSLTIEKSVVLGWTRIPGCGTDMEARVLARALARNRGRFAFPDDFVSQIQRFLNRLRKKHDKQSPEGRALRRLREIRVMAQPEWSADRIELQFLFLREEADETFEGKSWDGFLEAWLSLIEAGGRFGSSEGVVTTLSDLTAREYLDSDPLDLDYLSSRSEP